MSGTVRQGPTRNITTTPPVYRPQPSASQAKLAPAVYRPQPAVSQAKLAPPVYRPQPPRIMQTRASAPAAMPSKQIQRPPVYRSQPATSQAKPAPPAYWPQLPKGLGLQRRAVSAGAYAESPFASAGSRPIPTTAHADRPNAAITNIVGQPSFSPPLAFMIQRMTPGHKVFWPEIGRVKNVQKFSVIQRSITCPEGGETKTKGNIYWAVQLGISQGSVQDWALAELDKKNPTYVSIGDLRQAVEEFAKQNAGEWEKAKAEKAASAREAASNALAKSRERLIWEDSVRHSWEAHTEKGIRTIGRVITKYGGRYGGPSRVAVLPEKYGDFKELQALAELIDGNNIRGTGGGKAEKSQTIDGVPIKVLLTIVGDQYLVNTFFPTGSAYEYSGETARGWASEGLKR